MHTFGVKTAQDVIAIVDELRERIADLVEVYPRFDDDLYLLQWLKRHQFKLEKIVPNIRESVAWRKEMNFDILTSLDVPTEFPGLCDQFPVYFEVLGRRGQPVFTFNGDGIDNADAIFRKYGDAQMFRYILGGFAKAEEKLLQHIQAIKARLNIKTLRDLVEKDKMEGGDGTDVQILDVGVGSVAMISFKDFSLWNSKSPAVMKWIFEVARVGTNYFPIFLTTAYLININKFVAVMIKIIKPIIASPSFNIVFFDSDKSKWMPALHAEIEPEKLSPQFGGTFVAKIDYWSK